MEHLECDPRPVAVQFGRFGHGIVIALRLRLVHHQQGCGLREVAIEQLVEFMPRLFPTRRPSSPKSPDTAPQDADQQPGLQRPRRAFDTAPAMPGSKADAFTEPPPGSSPRHARSGSPRRRVLRRWWICTSIALFSTSLPQAYNCCSSSSRVSTRAPARMSACSRSNSRCDSTTAVPCSSTWRCAGSSVRAPREAPAQRARWRDRSSRASAHPAQTGPRA